MLLDSLRFAQLQNMGNAQGIDEATAAKVSKKIAKRMKEDHDKDRDTIKLLLLGTGE